MLLVFFNTNAIAQIINPVTNFTDQCSFNSSKYIEQLSDLNNLVSIEIDVIDYRKWAMNTLKAMVNKNNSILPKYKKRFSANIKTNYTFGHCNHFARIRLHGDWKDHIELMDANTLISSLDVSLKNGSIANFVKFKLLLEATRNGDNEVILANLLRKIGIISPRTSNVDVILHGKKINMIIQEKSVKEMLENLKRKENFMFEGDERFLFKYENYTGFQLEQQSLSKIMNPELMSLGTNNTNIALKSLSNLQSIYIKHANHNPNGYILDWKKLANKNYKLIEKWAHYEILMYASNSFHALRPHNRKFYLNPFYKGFEPIYFDGNSMSLLGKWMRIRPDYNYLPHLQVKHFSSLENLISNLKIEEIEINLSKGNKNVEIQLRKIKEDLLAKILILKNEFLLHKDKSSKNTLSNANKENQLFKNNLRAKLQNSHTINLSTIIEADGVFNFELCSVRTNNCILETLELNGLIDLVEQKKIAGMPQNYPIVLLPDEVNSSEDTSTISYLDGNINIKTDAASQTLFNKKENKLSISLKSQDSWVLIFDSNLTNINIDVQSDNMKNINIEDRNERINNLGLTGCINIYNASMNQTSIQINSENIKCEDSLNIINSEGHISEINILNAQADGLDIDFSSLKIEEIRVTNALNDCVDVSGGNYQIEYAKLQKCGDKGLSIGESSKLNAKNITIENALIGVSSKDSSVSHITDLLIKNSDVCTEVFQKKQEFNGSFATIENMNCTSSINKVDLNSILLSL